MKIEKQNKLPILLWIPKMHKNPSKQRFIAASHCCTTKNISSLIGKCLKLIQKAHQVYCDRKKNYSGYNLFWIVDNSLGVHKLLQQCDTKAKNAVTYDFSTLYTSIPHNKLKNQMSWVVEKAFTGMNKQYIKINKFCARWSTKKDPNRCNFREFRNSDQNDQLVNRQYLREYRRQSFPSGDWYSYGHGLCSFFSKFVSVFF